jgi:ubiquinone/menaquinone biosynthesis C-methylase UbiE
MGILSDQYLDSSNYIARIEINRRFRTNPQPWTNWIFDQIKFPENSKVLELGCGNGILWKNNTDKIPDDCQIILSDFSEGMLNDARNLLSDISGWFKYKIINAQAISYFNDYFDLVIANLMLYHIPNRKKALSEISRVLKSDGTFYSTTFGKSNMKEINDIVSNYDKRLDYSLEIFAKEFGLKNGKSQLKEYFEDVKLIRYPDFLEVTEADPIIHYVLSFGKNRKILVGENLLDFKDYLNEILDNNGKIVVTKDTGMFIAKKPLPHESLQDTKK